MNSAYRNNDSRIVDRFSQFACVVRDEREGEGTATSYGGGVRRQNKRGAVARLPERCYRRKWHASTPPTTRGIISADRCVQATAALRSGDRRRIASGVSSRFRPCRILRSAGHGVDRVREISINMLVE